MVYSIISNSFLLFVLLTPFFVLSLFLSVCAGKTVKEKQQIAIKTSLWIFAVCLIILFGGRAIFSFFGITLPAFQLGSGLILLLSGIAMVNGKEVISRKVNDASDPCLVPLTLPITVGPGTVGQLITFGAGLTPTLGVVYICALAIACAGVLVILYFSAFFERIFNQNGIALLGKLTGLFLAVLAMQSIINGILTVLEMTNRA